MVENSMIPWIKQNKVEFVVILLIFLMAIFLRFYRLDEYMTFLGDEGRDAIIVKNILVDHDLPFIGPPTSVGNIYLGPFYYYLMAVSMAIFWLNPVAAAGMVAIIGVLTIALIYYLSRRWFGFWPAVVTAILYALSPVTIIYSRSSWNPNPAPLFALLSILGFDQARRSKDYRFLILTGGAVGAAMQMHYLAMILVPIFILLWVYEYFFGNRGQSHSFFWGSVGGIVAFVLLMFPWLLFELKHDFLNSRAIINLFSASGGVIVASKENTGEKIFSIYQLLIGRYLGGENFWITLVLSLLVIAPIIILVKQKLAHQKLNWPILALFVWLAVGLMGLSFYRQSIYDHYLGFISPIPYLLIGGVINFLRGRWQLGAVLLLLLVVGFINLEKSPLHSPPNNQLQKTQQIAKFVIAQSGGKPYNFALIAERNYDAAYQFYLDIYGGKPKVVPLEITDQLFVVCEDSVCNPVGHPKYEIAAFGWAKIESVFNILDVKMYKLVPNLEGKLF